MAKKKQEFKLVRKVEIYEEVIVDAASKEEALELYDSGELEGWEEDDVSGSDCIGLTSIAARGKDGQFSIQWDVVDGKIDEPRPKTKSQIIREAAKKQGIPVTEIPLVTDEERSNGPKRG